MKTIAKLTALVALAVFGLEPAVAQDANHDICLKTYFIDNTHVVDAKTILFRMKDGTVYRNTLSTPCPGLLWNGFVYVLHYDELCSVERKTIRVLRTGEVCQLGVFTKLTSDPGK